MNIELIREYCLQKRGVTEDFPFDDVTLVIRVMDKMFVLLSLDNPDYVAMKCEPEYAVELRELYSEIDGAKHFNKKYWNQINLCGSVPDSLIKELIDHSYNEVIKKFTRKLRAQYEAIPNEL